MAKTAGFLRDNASRLLHQAAEQRAASAADSGKASTARAVVGAGNPKVTLRDLMRLPQSEQIALWHTLTREQQNALLKGKEDSIGNFDFIAPEIRYAANRQLVLEQYLLLNDMDGKLHGLPEGLSHRKDLYERILRDDEQVLFFDPSGDGRIGVVQGDLATAQHLAVSVPGISNSMDNYWTLLDEGKRLKASAGADSAVVTWLGYDTPVGVGLNPIRMGVEIATTVMAEPGASALVSFVDGLKKANPGADVTVIGHSYGSLVTGLAARQGLQADNVVFIGSPGVGANSVSDFNLPEGARVYAAEPGAAVHVGGVNVGGDFVSNIGHNAGPFGGVPTEPGFGAEVFDVGNRLDALGSHGDYYAEGSVSLQKLGAIVSGSGASGSGAW